MAATTKRKTSLTLEAAVLHNLLYRWFVCLTIEDKVCAS